MKPVCTKIAFQSQIPGFVIVRVDDLLPHPDFGLAYTSIDNYSHYPGRPNHPN